MQTLVRWLNISDMRIAKVKAKVDAKEEAKKNAHKKNMRNGKEKDYDEKMRH